MRGVSYLVGKTDEMTLYPLTFPEFVMASESGGNRYRKLCTDAVDDLDTLRESFMDLLRQYYFTEGMRGMEGRSAGPAAGALSMPTRHHRFLQPEILWRPAARHDGGPPSA